MFRKVNNRDITEEENKKYFRPHLIKCNDYLTHYSIPEYAAFFIAVGWYNSYLYEASFTQFINSALDVFNICIEDKSIIKKEIKKTLRIKYGLQIIEEQPILKLNKTTNEYK